MKRTREMTGTARVRLTRPGVQACGKYRRDTVYEVEAEEAERLVKVKGFEYVPREDGEIASAQEQRLAMTAPNNNSEEG